MNKHFKHIIKIIENIIINVIQYVINLVKTAQLINKRQIKQQAYELLEKEYNEIIMEYIAIKVYKIEMTKTRYTMEERRILQNLKDWLTKSI